MPDGDASTGAEAPAPGLPPERRLPVIVTLGVAMIFPFLMPDSFTPGARWLLPSVEGALLVAMAAIDPGRIDMRSRHVRALRVALIVVLVAGAAWATAQLITALVDGGPEVSSAGPLLRAGGLVWADMIIAFGFLYWELDAGGPGHRAHVPVQHPDLAFPQHLDPDIAPANWRPLFFDYLYLAYTNALAFSPTDVMPLTYWPKLAMTVESLTSLLILSLVIARAVNILG